MPVTATEPVTDAGASAGTVCRGMLGWTAGIEAGVDPAAGSIGAAAADDRSPAEFCCWCKASL
jgi:hypothetical protein